ncbi:MAG: hypothetical protein HC874_14345 [Richelia sp. SL_2_1]|nr:hypothetical protein [Richelia sp. SL_2_1]
MTSQEIQSLPKSFPLESYVREEISKQLAKKIEAYLDLKESEDFHFGLKQWCTSCHILLHSDFMELHKLINKVEGLDADIAGQLRFWLSRNFDKPLPELKPDLP